MYTLGTAAKATGVAKSTIHRAIKTGRLSARSKDGSGYEIDPAELHRVFPPLGQGVPSNASENSSAERSATYESNGTGRLEHGTVRTAALEAEVIALKELVRRLDLDKQDLRSDRDAWKTQAETAQRLLSVASSSPEPILSSLVGWLRGLKART